MSIRCAHCKGRHTRVETVQACAEAAKGFQPLTALPEGVYEGLGAMWGKERYRVVVPNSGRWAGYYFVNVIREGGETALTSKNLRDGLIDQLLYRLNKERKQHAYNA